jgi:DNA-binding Xre family transcriptional regulator
MSIEWRLRLLMAERGMFATSDLVGPLAERGIHLSREQVYRLVTSTPQRLSMDVLAALCDILACRPSDLIDIVAVNEQVRKTVAGQSGSPIAAPPVQRTRIRRPTQINPDSK